MRSYLLSRMSPFSLLIALLTFQGDMALAEVSYDMGVFMKFYQKFQYILEMPKMRPSSNWTVPTNINISVTFHHILGVNEKAHILISFLSSRQLWFNDYLVWKPEEFDGIDHLIVPLDFIWIPDFYIWEFVGENISPLMSYAYIHHTGKVICDQPIRAETSCYLDIFFFPFDTQKCLFTFGPYLHTVADITLGVHVSDEQLLSDSLQNLQDRGEWELRQINASIQQFYYQRDEWPMCVFTVKVRRKPTLYLVSLILPSAFLMLIDILSFYLPPHSLDRCAFKVTLLLGYTVFLLMMNNILPNNSGGTPLIGGYFLFCLALLVISLLESIFISYILNGLATQNRTVPQWVKSFVLGYMSQLICYKITDTREHHKKINVFTVGMIKGYEAMTIISTTDLNFTDYEYVQFFETFKDVISNKFLRPVRNWTIPVQLNITLTLYEIIGVDEKSHILKTYIWLRQFWYNEFLVWDPKDFNGLAKVSIPVDNIWRPDIYVYEFVEEDLSPQIPYLYVRNTGRVTHDKPLRIISSCNLDIFYFPFDIQTCTLSLGSYLHTAKDIVLDLLQTPEEITRESKVNIQSKGEWELLFIEAHTTTWQLQGEDWSKVIFKVRMKRRPLLYLVNLIVPSAFLMVIDLFSFYLPLHRVDRGAFKMTLLLGYTVFLLIMNDLLPNNAGGTPIIGIYFSVCLALMVISLMETIFVMNILHQTRSNVLEVPPFLRTLTFSIIAKLICSEPADEEKGSMENEVQQVLDMPENLKSPPLTQMLLKKLSEDIFAIRSHLDSKNKKALMQSEWIVVASLWDCLLFRVYLLFFVLFSVVIIVSWCMWYTA